ncbi:MAG: hypothetical protein NT037_16075 [Hyphomicrobiales bacterium]|nr:hypothetical protein [Hyphomicrobiales bacterium]
MTKPSFMQVLRSHALAARGSSGDDPWLTELENLKGHTGHDGVERLSTHEVFDHLEVPMKGRAGRMHRLARVMRSLGWQAVRNRGLNRGSYRDRVRGYARANDDR